MQSSSLIQPFGRLSFAVLSVLRVPGQTMPSDWSDEMLRSFRLCLSFAEQAQSAGLISPSNPSSTTANASPNGGGNSSSTPSQDSATLPPACRPVPPPPRAPEIPYNASRCGEPIPGPPPPPPPPPTYAVFPGMRPPPAIPAPSHRQTTPVANPPPSAFPLTPPPARAGRYHRHSVRSRRRQTCLCTSCRSCS